MSMFNMQQNAGRSVVGPADQQQPKQPERMVTLYNEGYAEGTLLEINHSIIRMPAQGKPFQIPARNARLFLRLYSRRAGGKAGVAQRPGGRNQAAPTAPPGYKLVPDAEYAKLTGEAVEETKVKGVVPDRVRILEDEKKAAVEAQAEKLAQAQAITDHAVEEDDFELDLVSGDIPDEIVEAHNSVEEEAELEDIMEDLNSLDE